ncbi:uncharacterized protein I303_107699 [Kwoniella dejecticola CBS 10117]
MKNVVRSDGTRILILPKLSHFDEMKQIVRTYTSKLILWTAMFIIWSYFYNGSWSTYLGVYFSVRARALSSLISPFFRIIGCFGLGIITDLKGFSQSRRAQFGFWFVILSNVAVYVWSLIMQIKFNRQDPGAIDWSDKRFAESFLPYFFIQTTGPLTQVIVSPMEFPRPEPHPILNCALMLACIPGMWYITNNTPDRIPADVIAEEMAAHQAKKMEEHGQEDKHDLGKGDVGEFVTSREVASLA